MWKSHLIHCHYLSSFVIVLYLGKGYSWEKAVLEHIFPRRRLRDRRTGLSSTFGQDRAACVPSASCPNEQFRTRRAARFGNCTLMCQNQALYNLTWCAWRYETWHEWHLLTADILSARFRQNCIYMIRPRHFLIEGNTQEFWILVFKDKKLRWALLLLRRAEGRSGTSKHLICLMWKVSLW